ncbi:MAG: DnaA/Hda family protein, partial [Alphaproteobacteria bacterium]|nr:DnaA/Hda family protein [Alphaproteobacteria bacterium]
MMRQLPLSLPHTAAMGADDFLVTPCNREAAAWVEKWPDWPLHGLIVAGLPGSGKTHLMSLWLSRSGGRKLGPEDLLAHDTQALIESAQKIAIDNADALAGRADAEEKLFHLYNALKEIKGFLFLTMSSEPAHAGFALPDLRSRLLALPVAPLLPPDDALLEALIVKQFSDRQIALDASVVSYLASHAPRDAASIRELVERLDL